LFFFSFLQTISYSIKNVYSQYLLTIAEIQESIRFIYLGKALRFVQNREQEKSLGHSTPRAGKVSRSLSTESRKSLSVCPKPRARKVSWSFNTKSRKSLSVTQHREQEKPLGLSKTESKENLKVGPIKAINAGLQVFGRTRAPRKESAHVLSLDNPKWL
jgi:hypothetical protein